MIFLVIKN